MGHFCHSRPSISFQCQVEQWGFFFLILQCCCLFFMLIGVEHLDCVRRRHDDDDDLWWWDFFFARWSVNLRTQFSSRALLLVCRRKLRLLSNQFYFLMWFARKKHSNRFTTCTYNGFRIMCGVFWNGNVLLLSINVMRSDDGRVDLQINIVNA